MDIKALSRKAAGILECFAMAAMSPMIAPHAEAEPVSSIGFGVTLDIGSRPSSVPKNYVLTPFGYFDPSCVISIPEYTVPVDDQDGVALVDVSGNASARSQINRFANHGRQADPQDAGLPTGPTDEITLAQITNAPHRAKCSKDAYDLSGKSKDMSQSGSSSGAVTPAAMTPNTNGWIASASTSALGAMAYLHAQWNVPRAPSSYNKNATTYYFPGFENTAGARTIIMQPVLAYNDLGNGGASGWSMSSWNCCSVGNVYHSAYVPVTGTTVSGDVSGIGCSKTTGVCSSWVITTYDWGSQRSTTFTTNSGGRVMNWVFGGAMESYGAATCAQLPRGAVTFKAFYIKDVHNVVHNSPTWSRRVSSGISPACGYTATVGSGDSVVLGHS